jgi:hypothetical protein
MVSNVYKELPEIRLHPGAKTPPFMMAAMRRALQVFVSLPPPTAETSMKVLRLLMVNLLCNITWEPPITRDGVSMRSWKACAKIWRHTTGCAMRQRRDDGTGADRGGGGLPEGADITERPRRMLRCVSERLFQFVRSCRLGKQLARFR